MPIATSARPDLVPAPVASRRVGAGAAAVLAAASLAVAALTLAALPRPAFVATAVIGAEGGPAAQRPAMIQAAVDAAASRPVLARAGTSLAGAAHLEAILSAAVRAEAGRVPGTLLVRANDENADKAAAMATTVADALVAELGARAQTARRDDDDHAARRLADLREAASAAHGRLAALGDTADLAADHAAATRVEALRGRLDAIRAILAAGNPPLGTGRDVPPAIDALQSSYLDLARRLATARETLGDRHTTIIGLRDGLARISTELATAWKRVAKATEAELAEASVRVTQSARGDASRAGALEAARREAQAADAALARAETSADDADVARFRLIAAAPVPATAEGLSMPTRLGIAISAGLATLLAGLALRRRRQPAAMLLEPEAPRVAEPLEPRFFDEVGPVAEKHFDVPRADEPMVADDASGADDQDLCDEDSRDEDSRDEDLRDEDLRDEEETVSMDDAKAGAPSPAHADLALALVGALPAIAAAAVRADIPVVMIATNEAGVATMDAVLALGEAAAAAGQRVLIVEGGRARPALAAAVDLEAEPAVVDLFGSPRIVLRAEAGDGLVYLAPSFRDGARLAADLVRSGEALLADALADEFDLVVIDGDRASALSEMTKDVDAVLRVGRFASARDDAHFLSTLGLSRETFLGTLVSAAGVFVPPLAAMPKPLPTPAPSRMAQPLGRRPLQVDVRRRVGAR